MKKRTVKRVILELIQHVVAGGIMTAAAWLLLNSYIAVDSIDGPMVYEIFPIDVHQEFEESEIYHDLFRNAVSDITQLVVIKGQLETDGVFDPAKKIDVTKYASGIGADNGCRVTAVYDLDDIIKWGKTGVDYTNRVMSMSEFVNYFGNCLYPENFAINEYEELRFDQFYHVGDSPEETEEENAEDTPYIEEGRYGKTGEEIAAVAEYMKEYTKEQLEDIVFSYLMTENLRDVRLNREDDGSLTVRIPMLICRYATVDGQRQLTAYADNWVDYIRLQDNIAAAVDALTVNYQRYQICNSAYEERNSNIKYMVRMVTDEGMHSYTNVAGLVNLEEGEVTDFFAQYRRYLIYYPDSLVFMGNTILSEEELDSYISVYDYAYPDTTHIWLGVDSDYSIEQDAFYMANALYEKIVPNVNRMMTLMILLAVFWLGIGIFLTVTAGNAVDGAGNRIRYLNKFDRIWTEILILLGAALVWGGVFGYRLMMKIAATAGVVETELMGIQLVRFYRYGVFILFGIYASIFLDVLWFSLVRRLKVGNLWSDSFLCWICNVLGKSVKFVIRHRSSAVSLLLPYNLFLFANLAGIFAVYQYWEEHWWSFLILAVLVALDGIVGVLMFRRNAEQMEIVEGINRIRDGEVEFKLDAESLHGSSRELADAVNNIGEGIRKAVKTSMKDEQLKTDLITNVSHDIKTPLTSIINYVDLLKRLKIQEEPAKGYIDILDGKAHRLKQLTDDLVEASKISSGNIKLDFEKLNLTELIQQSIGEFSEKLQENKLQIVFENDGMPAYIYADSSWMWRVAENLFNNICKYAMEGTRVYIDITRSGGKIETAVKNISKQQMNVRPEELTERFIRGDSARSTEGSGLGLSITKNLVKIQGGEFALHLDGDLFKISLSFPEYDRSKETQALTK